VCVFLTRHMSRVLKFFLHLAHTARRESGNFTFNCCEKPGGVNVKMFYDERAKGCHHNNQVRKINHIYIYIYTYKNVNTCNGISLRLTPCDVACGYGICYTHTHGKRKINMRR
jgi:hypothetical protein